jgi:hypothetical protein
MMRGWWAAAAILACAGLAHADPSPTELQAARDLFGKAEADEDVGHWAAALDKLHRAASVKATPGLLFHIALCEEKLDLLVAALADYTAAEQAAREQSNKEVLNAVSEPLRAIRIRVPTLTLDVPEAQGALVALDGKTIAPGLYGVAMPVEPGVHHIEATAPGRETFAAQVQLSEREAITTSIKWVTKQATVAVRSDPFEGSGSEKPSHEERTKTGMRWGAIVSTASAVALFGFGLGSYFAADGAQTTLFQQCPTMVDCSGLRTPVRTWDAVALGSWIASAGMTALAIVLWLKPSQPKTSAQIDVNPFGVALRGSF